jgi:hypothetical protein
MKKSAIILPALLIASATVSAQVTNVAMGQNSQNWQLTRVMPVTDFQPTKLYIGQINGSQFSCPPGQKVKWLRFVKCIMRTTILYDKVRRNFYQKNRFRIGIIGK